MIIHKLDNVEVKPESGHKYALSDIKCGENFIKYAKIFIKMPLKDLIFLFIYITILSGKSP